MRKVTNRTVLVAALGMLCHLGCAPARWTACADEGGTGGCPSGQRCVSSGRSDDLRLVCASRCGDALPCAADENCVGITCLEPGRVEGGAPCDLGADCVAGFLCSAPDQPAREPWRCLRTCGGHLVRNWPGDDTGCAAGEICQWDFDACVSACDPTDPVTCRAGEFCRYRECRPSMLDCDLDGTDDCVEGTTCDCPMVGAPCECVDAVQWDRRYPRPPPGALY